MKKVRVELGARSYDIVVGRGILREATRVPGSRAFVVADARLKSHARKLCAELKRARRDVKIVFVRADEGLKSIEKIQGLYAWLLKHRADRHSVLFALGGGTIGDAVGFVAATYMRGIRWVGVPTTLLAQVDSSIGGKTGINHARGKNLIGAFHQPSRVICDVSLLESLPEREIVSGLGEMLKYGLIYDAKLFGRLEKNWREVLSLRGSAIIDAIAACARYKANAVSRDEQDRQGVREVLNFGHTVGHAIEAATGYKALRHGEAIILGMRAAALISVLRGHLSPAVQDRIEACLAVLPIPSVRKLNAEKLLQLVRQDKKAKDGQVRFVLLRTVGKTVLDRMVRDPEIKAAIKGVIG